MSYKPYEIPRRDRAWEDPKARPGSLRASVRALQQQVDILRRDRETIEASYTAVINGLRAQVRALMESNVALSERLSEYERAHTTIQQEGPTTRRVRVE